MNTDRVQMFRQKLDNLAISDYHGLNSPGLTCYLNSVLQVLFMTEDFRSSIKRCCTENSTSFDTLLGELFDDLEKDLAKTHSFIKTLGITDVYVQRDAAEYLEKILCLTSLEASKIFKGELHYKTTCVKCKTRNDSWSVFRILPLAMENSCHQIYSVERGLKAFFRKEQVCGDNKMYCNHCNKKQDADIDCEMTQTPSILTLLLKRFTFDHNRKSYVKHHCKVCVPETLHIENCKYYLYALVNHFGGLTGGHYTAEIKSFETGVWYCFNDDLVEMVKQPPFEFDSSVRSCTAYLLMYKKKRTHSERSDHVDDEDQHIQLNVEAEGRCNGAEEGEAHVPPYQLKDKSCSRDKNLNGVTIKTNKAGHHEPNRQHLNTNSDHIPTHCVTSVFEENHTFLKNSLNSHDIAWNDTGQDNDVLITGTKTRVRPAESVGSTTREAHINHRNSSSLKRNQQPAVSTSEGRTQETTQTVTKGVKTAGVKMTRKTKRSEGTVKRLPWR